jgi:hypothetical protein
VQWLEEADKVLRMRAKLGLPAHFTFRLPARRHDGVGRGRADRRQGRALSAHCTQQAYIGYAKRTEKRVLAATRKRHGKTP